AEEEDTDSDIESKHSINEELNRMQNQLREYQNELWQINARMSQIGINIQQSNREATNEERVEQLQLTDRRQKIESKAHAVCNSIKYSKTKMSQIQLRKKTKKSKSVVQSGHANDRPSCNKESNHTSNNKSGNGSDIDDDNDKKYGDDNNTANKKSKIKRPSISSSTSRHHHHHHHHPPPHSTNSSSSSKSKGKANTLKAHGDDSSRVRGKTSSSH
ncbi:hypothetical protein RFI_17428, partial [Reticulomyxa filosa]